MAMIPFLMVGGFFAIVVIAIVAGLAYERKRSDALKAVADAMNFTFCKESGMAVVSATGEFHLFSQGHSRKITNLMRGTTNDIEVSIFDYRYTVGSGKNSSTHRQTVVVFQSSLLNLPDFALRPEHVFHRIGKAFGYQDITFDRYPLFSKKCLLRGSNEEAIRKIFHDGVLKFYEGHQKLCTEGSGNQLVLYRTPKRVRPTEVSAFLQEAFEVFALFKISLLRTG
jgi:hypothetical protein